MFAEYLMVSISVIRHNNQNLVGEESIFLYLQPILSSSSWEVRAETLNEHTLKAKLMQRARRNTAYCLAFYSMASQTAFVCNSGPNPRSGTTDSRLKSPTSIIL